MRIDANELKRCNIGYCSIPHIINVQVSEAGVHRPHVAGIAARENEGAFSIVLSGGYEDDVVSMHSYYRKYIQGVKLSMSE